MKNLFIILLILFSCTSIFATDINGRLIVQSSTDTTVSVLLQINTNTGTDDMGGATIAFEFDNTCLSIPATLQSGVNYVYHNFSGGNYSVSTVTRPSNNMVWANIDLYYLNNNNGTVVSGPAGWTDVVTINFKIIRPSTEVVLRWFTESQFWGVYDGNNTTMWNTGDFQNLILQIDTIAPEVYQVKMLE